MAASHARSPASGGTLAAPWPRSRLEGPRIGQHFTTVFPPVTAQLVCLEVLDTTINPLVTEFHLYRSE